MTKCLLGLVLLVGGCASAADDTSRAGQWRQDIQTLDREFSDRQIDPWARMQHAEWAAAIERLKALPFETMSDAAVALEIERLLARFHDGHIRVMTDGAGAQIGAGAKLIPLRFRWFPEGIYVVDAADARYVGARLVRLGETRAEALPERIAPWVSVENDSGLHAAVYAALSNATLLQAAGVTGAGNVAVELRLSDGETVKADATPQASSQIVWQPARKLPWFRQARTPANWLEEVPGRGVIYLRYAECHDGATTKALAKDLEARLEKAPAMRLIVDLRGNEGGDSGLFAPVLRVVRQSGLGKGRLDVLADRNTFSSGYRNLMELRAAGARQWGEAPGQRPVYTGDVKSFVLPHSRVVIRYTTKWSRLGALGVVGTAPDVAVQPGPEEFLRGDDPVLARVLGGR
jgi:hypothetical protein